MTTVRSMTNKERIQTLIKRLKDHILVIDGAMGTCLQDQNLTAKDFGGEEYEGCNEILNLTRPDVIKQIHLNYLEAGADIIETNTFGGTPLVLDEYDLADKYFEINYEGTKLARLAADEMTKKDPNNPRFVAGSMGPTTKAISVTGGVTFEQLRENFRKQARPLIEGGCDYLLIETSQDTRNIKAAILGIQDCFEDIGTQVPIAVSGTIEPMGTMLAGQTVEALSISLEHVDLLYLGLNCATGPEFMTDHIRSMSELTPSNVAVVPNAGLPDEDGNYLETPDMMCSILGRFIENGWVNLLGGCCGTTYDHIKAFKKLALNKTPRKAHPHKTSLLSGMEPVEVNEDNRPILVGERTNVIGSRKFKKLIADERFDEAAEIAKAQVKKGAQVIDICLANPDRDEFSDMRKFLDKVIHKVKAPLMIDSTDEKVIEMALTYSQGKAIINSINLEDGEERFEKVVPLGKKFGAAFVVGTIDDDPEQGMGVTRERKLEIAERSYKLLVDKYGVKPEDIYWDPLVFPCATGDENYIGSAEETIEGIRLLKEKFPGTKTVLGISNISFGLPPAGREVLNSVFLYLCTQSGLDMGLVNTQVLERYSNISKEEIELSHNLLFNKGDDPVGKFAAHFRDVVKTTTPKESLPLKERLGQYIIEGTKEGLIDDLEEMRKTMPPMEIINGPLMKGMDVVGKLFNENKLIVAEVLQSAESMKHAVAHLEQFMEKDDKSSSKGKIVLATVKGDVHDIGKNLVDIVLSNNGFEVVNLGIKITSEQLIKACKEHNPDIVGLSGLLVKSAQQMVLTSDDLKQAGIEVPILVGGAALSRNFVNKKIAPQYQGTVAYAKDAMDGLSLANRVIEPSEFEKLKQIIEEQQKEFENEGTTNTVKKEIRKVRSKKIEVLNDLPKTSDFKRHLIKNTPMDVIFKYINPLMLYGRHLGIKGKLVRLLDPQNHKELLALPGGEKAKELWEQVEEVKKLYKKDFLIPSAVYQFFRAYSHENQIHVLNEAGEVLKTFDFPRQDKEDGLCLSDYVSPNKDDHDSICLFLVSVGKNIRQEALKLKDQGNYLHSHILSALALECAEGYAEYLHSRIRALWGYPDSLEMTMMDRFKAQYHGKRYSFGYPACPRLDDQEILFDLLKPSQDLDVELTDGFMMDPEASVSALCFHHPKATYFSVGNIEE